MAMKDMRRLGAVMRRPGAITTRFVMLWSQGAQMGGAAMWRPGAATRRFVVLWSQGAQMGTATRRPGAATRFVMLMS